MTLDEAIKQCNDTAEQNEKTARRIGWQYEGTLLDREAKECRRFAAEHRQLAEWLKELKELKAVRRGRWIIADDVEHFIAVCSECGRTEDSRDIKDMPYCHCGARMDGDTNG